MRQPLSDEYIKKFRETIGWTLGGNSGQKPRSVQQRTASIDALINSGRVFYSKQKDSKDNNIGVAVALQEAYNSDVIIATAPYLIAGKAQADKNNYLWKKWFSPLTEENAGIDKDGKLVGKGQEIVLTLHGGGILTPERIRQAYSEGLTPQHAAKYTDEEFDNLLNGMLPSGERINSYTVDDVIQGKIPDPFGRYVVWMPAETAKSQSSGDLSRSDFMKSKVVIARVGTLEYLDVYFEKAKNTQDNTLGSFHRFGDIDFRQSQGCALLVYISAYGLSSTGLNTIGCFVGVAPEKAQGVRK